MDSLLYIAKRFKLLYRIPPAQWFLIAASFIAFWTVLMLFLCKSFTEEQNRNTNVMEHSSPKNSVAFVLNLILMLVGMTIIFLVTFVRRGSSEHQVIIIPLRVLFGQRAPRDYWHVTVMNIVLFLPFSCGLCFVMGKKITHPFVVTILICFIFSAVAEALQYIFGSGLAEIDDILMNTLGGVIGTLPYAVISIITH